MSVRFIFGRAGSGKTHYCLESVRRELASSSPRQGGFLLVPEQSTAITERELLTGGALQGFTGQCVVSFRRLAYLVTRETRTPIPRLLASAAMRSLVAAAVARSREQLGFYGQAADQPGFQCLIGRFLREAGRNRIISRDFDRAAQNLPGADSELAGKLRDLALIYQYFCESLPPGCATPEHLLELLIDAIPRSKCLDGVRIWVDGFAGFTVQEEEVLQALAKKIETLEIALCLDPQRVASANGLSESQTPEALFLPVEEAYFRLKERFGGAGIPVHEPLRLPRPGQPGRFAGNGSLAHLEKHWGNVPPGRFPDPAPEIQMVTCADRRTEVRAAAEEILRLCREENLGFREIAVLVRDLEPYRDLLESEFPRCGIPFFCDVPASLALHPLPAVLRSAVAAVVSDWDRDFVLDYLKTDLAPVTRDETDRLENHALERGITGKAWWDDEVWCSTADQSERHLVSVRDRGFAPLHRLAESLLPRGDTPEPKTRVRAFCTALFRFLQDIAAGDTLKAWEQEDLENSQHRAVWDAVLDLLDDWVAGAGDLEFSPRELAAQLDRSLAELKLPFTPPALDQVTVGSLEYSRQPDVRAAVVLGLNEGLFPRPRREDALLDDDDRAKLAAWGIRFGPPGEILRARESYLAYIALTRPRERVWLSYALSEPDGTALFPSPLIAELEEMLPNLRKSEQQATPVPKSPHEVTMPCDLPAQVLRVLRDPPEDKGWQTNWLPLLEWSVSPGNEKPTGWRKAYAALEYRNKASLTPDVVKRSSGENLTTSVSEIESMAACPFQHFARYVLRLERRRDYRVEPIDVGHLFHRVMCGLFHRLQNSDGRWSTLDERQARIWVGEEIQSAAANLRAGLFMSTGTLRFMTNRAEEALMRLLKSLISRDQSSAFHQTAAEISFGFEESSLPALLIPLGGERHLALRGIIDRIDTIDSPGRGQRAVLVIDYKTTPNKLDFARAYHGLDMQLLAYLLAVTEPGGNSEPSPAGAVYLHVLEPIREGAAAGEASATRKARGVLAAEYIQNLDTACQTGRSEHFNFLIKQSGELGDLGKSDAVPLEMLRLLLRETGKNLARYVRRILGGQILVRPYLFGNRSPCQWCDYQSVCRFERGINGYRVLEAWPKGEVLRRLEDR